MKISIGTLKSELSLPDEVLDEVLVKTEVDAMVILFDSKRIVIMKGKTNTFIPFAKVRYLGILPDNVHELVLRSKDEVDLSNLE